MTQSLQCSVKRLVRALPAWGVPGAQVVVEKAEPKVKPERAPPEEGTVSLVVGGFGFVQPKQGDSCFLSPQQTDRLLTGDIVRFERRTDANGRQFAKVCEFVRREAQRWLGGIERTAQGWQLVPDDPMSVTVVLPQMQDVLSMEPGQVFSVRTPAHEGPAFPAQIIEAQVEVCLGDRARPGFVQDYALMRFQHQDSFSAEALAAAGLLAAPDGAHVDAWLSEGLEDLRHLPFVTIDGDDTRDIDDAIWAEPCKLPNGDDGFRLSVAIADVSHYIPEGSVLDRVAAARGTSVYLPGKLLPMLPESLSAGVCSLFAHVPRRAVVLTMEVGCAGVVSRAISRAVIQSRAQLTYDLVAAWMAAPEGLLLGREDITGVLRSLAAVYQGIARVDRGALTHDDDADPSFTSKENGEWSLEWMTRTEAHKLIEQLMLLANQQAAALFKARYGHGLFRHQPPPRAMDWQQLQDWAASHGVALPEQPSMHALTVLADSLGQVVSPPALVQRLRKIMQPASYVVGKGDEGGHFSLGFSAYTHFTSPIRRYADLLVHRWLLAPEGEARSVEELERQAAQCSARARAAKYAELYVWDHYKRESILREQDGLAQMTGMVLRSTGKGLKVLLVKWQYGATIPGDSLRALGFHFDKQTAAWVRSTTHLAVGAYVTCQLEGVSLARPAYPEILLKLGGLDA